MAGISSSGADAAPLSPPPEPPAAEGHGGGAAKVTTFSPLVDLLQRFPDLSEQKVLRHLDPIDRTFLAQAGSACRAAVAASDLPRAGTRRVVLGKSVWVVTHDIREFCTSVVRLAWAKNSGCPWWSTSGAHSICLFAARGGHLDVLRWARERHCPWNEATCCYAAEGGHLEVMRWARDHDCPWDSRTCAWAAKHGHLVVLRWAREHDCQWDDMTCLYAARNGHLEVLQWARANGCPWSKRACVNAAMWHPETVAWVRAQQP
jgi:hypothetical protein